MNLLTRATSHNEPRAQTLNPISPNEAVVALHAPGGRSGRVDGSGHPGMARLHTVREAAPLARPEGQGGPARVRAVPHRDHT